MLLCLGLIGVALVRKEGLHFLLFTVHIVGYSIADTALVSLITRYSSQSSQGRDLSYNQATQALARVLRYHLYPYHNIIISITIITVH